MCTSRDVTHGVQFCTVHRFNLPHGGTGQIVIRPDDLEHLQWRLRENPDLWPTAALEAQRALASGPDNSLAATVAAYLASGPM